MDREAWWATVHGVARSRAHLSDLAHISGRGRAVGSGGSGHLGGAVTVQAGVMEAWAGYQRGHSQE